MGYRHALLALSIALLGSLTPACGKQIGDACQINSDCASDGTRICDLPSQSPGGYCTIQGCDYSTCPDEAVCVRFFPGGGTGKSCNPKDTTGMDPTSVATACTLDELCSLAGAPTVTVDDEHPLDSQGSCVLRSSEVRYCMKQCDSNDDCRDGYECRDLARMKDHGGEPMLAPGKTVDASAPKFCAIAP